MALGQSRFYFLLQVLQSVFFFFFSALASLTFSGAQATLLAG